MRWYRWLALVPAIGMLGGVPFVNHVKPFVFGLPLLLAWVLVWVLLTSATMWLIYALDRRHERRAERSGA
ncbi:MAG TPA: DUF3311 domain-containing protein [Gemmatimonadaceae bacterium]|jgi:hypothetical protein